MPQIENPCPVCGGPTIEDFSCPRYGGKPDGTGWFCCFPFCGNATEYECVNDECGWGYIDGLNPDYEAACRPGNAKERPPWLTKE